MATERRQAEKTSFVFGREDENTGSPITDTKVRSSNGGMSSPRGTTTRIRRRNRAIRFAPVVRMFSVKTDFYGVMGT